MMTMPRQRPTKPVIWSKTTTPFGVNPVPCRTGPYWTDDEDVGVTVNVVWQAGPETCAPTGAGAIVSTTGATYAVPFNPCFINSRREIKAITRLQDYAVMQPADD